MSVAAGVHRARTARRLVTAATIVGLLAAVGAWRNASVSQAEVIAPDPLFATWSTDSARAVRIDVTSRDGALTLLRGPDGWRVESVGGYPVTQDRLGRVGVALANMRYLGLKTQDPDKHAALGLVSPDEGGGAARLTIADPDATVLIDVLIGETRPEGGFYARFPGEDRTYAITGERPQISTLRDWVELDVIGLERGDIAQVAVAPVTGPDYVLSRLSPAPDVDAPDTGAPAPDAASDPAPVLGEDFALIVPETGWTLLTAGAGNVTGAAVARLRFEDVERVDARPLPEPFASHVAETVTGASIGISLSWRGDEVWARLDADTSQTAAQEYVEALSRRIDGWIFKLPEYAAERLVRPLSEMALSDDPESAGTGNGAGGLAPGPLGDGRDGEGLPDSLPDPLDDPFGGDPFGDRLGD